ncbi:unnamed protein product [Cyprideis torosa]|uniref:Uncharacterized protein n=1 Tax=Cyprideis torosa TaxID=163714 RepID=A0A7R8WPM9_9CRUS|nr:unnamed protein product [Cyprideis torosa]CAG0905820.1 unnamed protein product [Cyprideis torosa]
MAMNQTRQDVQLSPPHITTASPSSRASSDKVNRAPIKDLLEHVIPLFKQYRLRLFLGFTALLLVDFLQLTIPRILKTGVDRLTDQNITENELFQLGLFIVAIAILVALLRFVWRYAIIGFSRYLERVLRNRIFFHILKMDESFLAQRTTGDIMAHASNDLNAVQMACGMGMVAAADALVMSVAAISFMTMIHPQLTLLALLPMPFLAIITRLLSAKLHRRFNSVQEQFSFLTEFCRANLVSIKLLKAYTMEKMQARTFDQLGKKYVESNLLVARIQGLLSPTATLIGNLCVLLLLFFGGRLVVAGSISMGDFVAFITYLYMLIWPMMAIGWVANLVQRGLTSLNRIDTLLKEKSLLPEKPLTLKPKSTPLFGLRHLNFTYPRKKRVILQDICADFWPGMHGITGRTGCGKSTLCKVLARLYPVEDGQYLYSGTDVNCLDLTALRSQIAYVAQEPVLFSDTIAANIALASPESTEDEIQQAARLAAIDDEIQTFADGYMTRIGERGVKLSGGQRQRIALARALLAKRPVLLIDDALSAVDVKTERKIIENLKGILKDSTLIIVSNRLPLLSLASRILLLEDGKIAQDGSHEQLLDNSPFYRSMYAKQRRREQLQERGAP